jgi:hypothetical protein
VSDPLGMTPDQRMLSNVFAAFRGRGMWWPEDIDQAPEPIGEIAETLDDVQARLADPGGRVTLQDRPDYPDTPCPLPGHGWKWIPRGDGWECSDCRFDPPKEDA